MDLSVKESLWQQFGASIDMLENAIELCPEKLWYEDNKFWYMAYHSLFWLDYYLSLEPKNFSPPEPFNFSEFDPSGALPDKAYSKQQLLVYLQYTKNKCRDLIAGLNDGIAQSRWINASKNYSVFEIILYNMRHVQHHAGQLNLILRQKTNDAPKWVTIAKEKL